jgi:Putative prokaryotic signal transducing protein
VEPDDSVVLTVVSGGPEAADVVCGLLRSAGIECAYRDTEAIDSSLEEFTAAGPQEILVHASDLDTARDLIAAPTTEGPTDVSPTEERPDQPEPDSADV